MKSVIRVIIRDINVITVDNNDERRNKNEDESLDRGGEGSAQLTLVNSHLFTLNTLLVISLI